MRVVALEEHFNVPALVKRIDPATIKRRGYQPRRAPPAGRPSNTPRLHSTKRASGAARMSLPTRRR